MTALICGLLAACLVMWAAWHRQAHSQNIKRLRPVTVHEHKRFAAPKALTRLLARWDLDVRERRLTILALSASVATVFVLPVLSILALPTCAMWVWWSRRSARSSFLRAVSRDISLTVDLLRLAVRSGCNVTAAIGHVSKHLSGPLPTALEESLSEAARGRRLADALELCTQELGEEVKPLIWSLVAAERYGAPLSEALERLSHEARLHQERRYEQAAKRLSVQLLFPVAGCTLPAFALLTVAPLLAGSLSTLASSFR